jgi:hypothetical protein
MCGKMVLQKERGNKKMIGEIVFWLVCLVGAFVVGGLIMPNEEMEISKYSLDRMNGLKY